MISTPHFCFQTYSLSDNLNIVFDICLFVLIIKKIKELLEQFGDFYVTFGVTGKMKEF